MAAEDRQRRIAAEDQDRALAPYAPGDLVDDSIGKRYPQLVRDGQFVGTPQQREEASKEAARIAEREADRQRQELRDRDAVANRYHDSELRRQEREQDRADRQRESAADRANSRYVVDRQMAGRADNATQGQLAADSFYTRAKHASDAGRC